MIEVSHGKPYPAPPRARDLPATPATAVTEPDRDVRTGRFQPGNQASRRRALKRLAKQLVWLDPARCAPWAAPYVTAAKQHASDLLVDMRTLGPLTSPIAEELACARLAFRCLLQLGLAGDEKALDAARSWLREARQHALVLEGMARTLRAADDPESDLAARRAQFQRDLAARVEAPP